MWHKLFGVLVGMMIIASIVIQFGYLTYGWSL